MPYAELWDEVDPVDLFKIGFVKVGLSDLIDIAAVAFIFYKLLMLMKGTRAVQMLNAGLTLHDIQEALGHRSITTTANIYGRRKPADLKKVLAKAPWMGGK